MRSTVARSKRSVANTASPRSAPSSSTKYSDRSNFEAPLASESGSTSSPGGAGGAAASSSSTSITWNSGLRLRSRSGRTSSTSRSKGTSWWA